MPWGKQAYAPQLLRPCAATTEAQVPRGHALQEKPLQEEACAPQREALVHGNQRRPVRHKEGPAQPTE